VKITINHMAEFGYCVPGVRQWFAQRDLDFRDFCRNGLDEQVFVQADDAMALQLIAKVKQRYGQE
jgi:hypothetical protein